LASLPLSHHPLTYLRKGRCLGWPKFCEEEEEVDNSTSWLPWDQLSPGFDKALGEFKAAFANVAAAMDPAKLNQLLTTTFGMLTAFASAFNDDPPDFQHAVQSLNLQGWEIVKLLIPEEDQHSDCLKHARNAWDHVFADATDRTDKIARAWNEGDVVAMIEFVLATVEIALKTTAEVAKPCDAKILDVAAQLLVSLGDEWLNFSDWL